MAELPILTGTPKQVAWAEQIRSGALLSRANRFSDDPALAAEFVSNLVGRGLTQEQAEAVVEASYTARREALAELRAQTSASWWIDNRFEVPTWVSKADNRARQAVAKTFV